MRGPPTCPGAFNRSETQGTHRPFQHCCFTKRGETAMRKLTLAAVAVSAISAAIATPAEARWGGGWHGGWGPGIGFGLAAGALAFGAAAAASPYYYGPGYYYYGYGPAAYGYYGLAPYS